MSGHREGVNKRKFSSIVEVISDENDNDHNDEILAKKPRTPKVGMSDNDNLETNNKPSPVFARKTRPVEEIIVANDGGHEMNNNVDSDIDHDKRQLPRPENTQHIIMVWITLFNSSKKPILPSGGSVLRLGRALTENSRMLSYVMDL